MLEQLPPHVLIVSAVFLLAGAVKGMTGMGLPTVAMGALGDGQKSESTSGYARGPRKIGGGAKLMAAHRPAWFVRQLFDLAQTSL
jgi:hypothetical protein